MLPTSGTLSATQINTELGRSSTSKFDMNATEERTLAWKNTDKSTIKFSDFKGRPYKYETPSTPVIAAEDYGSVKLTSSSGTQIVFNGETKASGSWWHYSGSEALVADAYAYKPASGEYEISKNSSKKKIYILGATHSVGSNGNRECYGYNQNNYSVYMYIRSTKYTIRGNGGVSMGGGMTCYFTNASSNGGVYFSANQSRKKICYGSSHDSFDNDENECGRYLTHNMYSYFTKDGWIKSALSKYRFNHRDYRIEAYLFTDPGLK